MQEPSEEHSGPGVRELIAGLQRRLGAMLDDPGLAELRGADPTHPAVRRYDALERLGRAQGSIDPSHADDLLEALRQWIDVTTWTPRDPEDDVWTILADPEARRRTRAALAGRSQFDDAMAELYFLGSLTDKGFAVERIEADGISDLVIDAEKATEVRGEVKRIHDGTGPGGVAAVIAKANRQIKRSAPPGGGIAFVSLGLPIRPAPAGDGIPVEVLPYVEEARRATRVHNSSVGQVVLAWEDYMTFGESPGPTLVAVRRRSTVVEHARPARRPAIGSDALDVGATAVAWVRFTEDDAVTQTPAALLRELRDATVPGAAIDPAATIELAPMWKDDIARRLPLRPNHVERAFREPDAVVLHADGLAAVVTRRVRTRNDEFVLVLHAGTSEPRQHWIADGGWRLYGTAAELDRLAGDPNAAFAAVLTRYGSRYRVGLRHVWWTASLRIRLPAGMPLDGNVLNLVAAGVGLHDAPESCMLHMALKVDSDHVMTIAGLFWIHLDRYEAALIDAARGRRR